MYKELTPSRKERWHSQSPLGPKRQKSVRLYATRLSAGGVALRQGDTKVFKKYSQMKLQMKREALEKMNRQANEMPLDSATATIQ